MPQHCTALSFVAALNQQDMPHSLSRQMPAKLTGAEPAIIGFSSSTGRLLYCSQIFVGGSCGVLLDWLMKSQSYLPQ